MNLQLPIVFCLHTEYPTAFEPHTIYTLFLACLVECCLAIHLLQPLSILITNSIYARLELWPFDLTLTNPLNKLLLTYVILTPYLSLPQPLYL